MEKVTNECIDCGHIIKHDKPYRARCPRCGGYMMFHYFPEGLYHDTNPDWLPRVPHKAA